MIREAILNYASGVLFMYGGTKYGWPINKIKFIRVVISDDVK